MIYYTNELFYYDIYGIVIKSHICEFVKAEIFGFMKLCANSSLI